MSSFSYPDFGFQTFGAGSREGNFTQNPNLRSKMMDFKLQREKIRKTEIKQNKQHLIQISYFLLSWVVYKQVPGIRGELQGGVLEGFELTFG